METIAFCEFDEHARKVLRKHWPDTPIHKDVRELDGKEYRGTVDVICGGFPCQDLSSAGKQAGFDGERSSLYREMLRVIDGCHPRYAVFENVRGLLTGGSGLWFTKFLYDLAQIGYDAEWHCIEASYVGAAHRRDRVWVLAYPAGSRLSGGSEESLQGVANLSIKLARSIEEVSRLSYPTQSGLRGADDGIPARLDRPRIARLGNTVVPQIPEAIGRAIMEVEHGA